MSASAAGPAKLHPYAAGIIRLIEEAATTQMPSLERAAQKIVGSVLDGGIVHVLGTGHSHILAEELFARASGPTFVNPILDETLMLHAAPGLSTRAERLHGYAEVVLAGHDLRAQDVMILVSNSGRNAVPIEAALYAKDRGVYTIAITSVRHSSNVPSRHSSGSKLMDVADIVLDTHAPLGDGQLTLASGESYGPTSTILGAVLGHTLLGLAIEELDRRGEDPRLLRSSNLDGSEDANVRRKAMYSDRIGMLR